MSKTLHIQEHYDESKSMLGFWIYLMTDLIMFAVFFAAYVVLHNNTFGGPSGRELFSMPFVLTETIILLTSSFTCGLGTLAVNQESIKQVLVWFGVTFALGASFLGMELTEFSHLITEGNSPQRNAFLSSFFTLVGAHGLHITFGLLWLGILLIALKKFGLSPSVARKFRLLSIFWHFLDIVWIFIFTIVYLLGVLK